MENKLTSHTKVLSWLDLAVGLVLSILVIYTLSLFYQHAGGLWRDEVSVVSVANQLTLSEMWTHLQWHVFPVINSVALRCWMAIFGDSDSAIRGYGLMIGLLTLLSLWLIARLYKSSAPLLSLGLFLLSPLAIQIVPSIRPFGIGILMTIVAMAFAWKVCQECNKKHIVLALIFTILSVQTHFSNAFLVLSIMLSSFMACLLQKKIKPALILAGIGLISALTLLPYIGIIRNSGQWSMLTKFENVTLEWLLDTLQGALSSGGQWMFYLWIGVITICLLIVICVYVPRLKKYTSQEQRGLILFCILTLFFSSVILVLAFLNMKMMTQSWYYLPLIAIGAIAVDTILQQVKYNSYIKYAILLCIIFMTWPIVMEKSQTRKTNIDLVAKQLAEQADKKDFVLILPWYHGVTFQHYYDGNASYATVPDIKELNVHRYDLIKEKMAQEKPIQPLIQSIARTLYSGHKLWIVGPFYTTKNKKQPTDLPPAPLEKYGWAYGMYLMNWQEQIMFILQYKCTKAQQLPAPTDATINPFENTPLFVLEGWRK